MPVESLTTTAAVPLVHIFPVLVNFSPGIGVSITLQVACGNIPLTGQSPMPPMAGMPPYQSPYEYQAPRMPASLLPSKNPSGLGIRGMPPAPGPGPLSEPQPMLSAAARPTADRNRCRENFFMG